MHGQSAVPALSAFLRAPAAAGLPPSVPRAAASALVVSKALRKACFAARARVWCVGGGGGGGGGGGATARSCLTRSPLPPLPRPLNAPHPTHTPQEYLFAGQPDTARTLCGDEPGSKELFGGLLPACGDAATQIDLLEASACRLALFLACSHPARTRSRDHAHAHASPPTPSPLTPPNTHSHTARAGSLPRRPRARAHPHPPSALRAALCRRPKGPVGQAPARPGPGLRA